MKNFARKILKMFIIICIILVSVTTLIGIAFAFYVDKYIEKSIDTELFEVVGSDSQTKLFYYDYEDRENRVGELIELTEEKLYGGYRCKYVSYEEVPNNLKNAFISIEDKRFEKHNGVDWFRTFTAGMNYYLKFSHSYGGSTITQQLIKNVTDKDDYTFQRKIQEIFWALDLESKMDKKEILGLYMNIINLSQGCYGVGAASEYYFSKNVSELSLSECACIAAITNSPTYYDPLRNPDNNNRRRLLILKQMYELEYITEEEYMSARTEIPVLNIKDSGESKKINSWYTDMVIEDIISDLMIKYEYSRSMASLVVYTGGLQIYTVMDKDIQRTLEEYYADRSNFFDASAKDTPQSSMIIIDSKTGDILAVAGAIGEKSGNRIQNLATDTVRPAGSVIKPLSTYAPALEEGIITWASVYDDVPVNFGKYNLDANKGDIVEPVPWPKNSNGIYRGLTNINYAIEHSINTVTVKVLEELGLEKSFDFLYNKLQMRSLIPSMTLDDGRIISDCDYASLALGQFNYGATVREVTAAYSIFANDGIYNRYRSYYEVIDSRGEYILENKYHGENILSEENADIMTLMLQNVVKNGTANEIKLQKYVDCAGKTGTTQNKFDTWYMGYTDEYIAGVWFGYEYPKPLTSFAGNKCISIWDAVMGNIYADRNNESHGFDISPNIIKAEFCADSGKLLTSACMCDPRGERREEGYFVSGTQPIQPCDRHLTVRYDTASGGVVIGQCPEANTVAVGLIKVEREFPMQIYVTDAQYTWRDIGKDILPATSPTIPFYANILQKDIYCGISKTDIQYNRACREHFNYFIWKDEKSD